MSALSLAEWCRATEPALLIEGEEISFATLARLAEEQLQHAPASGPISFLAAPDLATLALALGAISRRRTIVPLHPKQSDDARARIVARATSPDVETEADALAILATSGSTGEPKLVELSRDAFLASARASEKNIPLGPGDRWLLAMPFAHAGGLSILTRCLVGGATVVVHHGFEAKAILASIVRDRVNVLSVVPTMLALLLREDGDNVLHRLKAMLVGGAACPPALLEECARREIPALATYGLTETCSQVTVQPLGRRDLRTAADSGLPLEGTTVEIVGDERTPIERGVGRIVVRGPTAMTGYLGHPHAQGTVVTEDLGSFDDHGRLRIVGRADDMIISGGENVHPLEVERRLLQIPGVTAALVAGIPDPTWGQRVGALVVLAEGTSIGEVQSRVAADLASHSRPRVWSVVAALPTNAIGKPDRREAARRLALRESGAT